MSEAQPGNPITAETVADYLAEHPDFLHDHPDLLAELLIPHATGSAVSLIERQVQVLRDKHATAQRQLHQLVEVARDNDRLAERMHQLALALLDCMTLADVIGAVDAKLSGAFEADRVALLLFDDRVSGPTLDDARWLSVNKPNTILSPDIINRLATNPDPRAAGMEIAADLLRELTTIPGVSGTHVYAPTDLTTIPEVLELAGLAD